MKKITALRICLTIVLLITAVNLSGCGKSEPKTIPSPTESTDTGTPMSTEKEEENPVTTPYIIDTVANADIIDIYSYSQDKEDNIYYYILHR